MSSAVRSIGLTKEGFTTFHKPHSPCYTQNSVDRLFPFELVNGQLNISYSGNSFKTLNVDISGVAPDNESDTSIQVMGGPRMVTSLGNNFKDYIRAWRNDTIDAGSPIELYQPCQVLRVRETAFRIIDADNDDSYKISTVAPTGDGYTDGGEANNYYTTFVFKTPLTFTIVESGVTKYITFSTYFDQE